MADEKKSFRDHVAETMLEHISQGTAPWQKPWDPGKVRTAPYNPDSNKPYRGINSFWLECQGHSDPRWLTYQQAESLGAQVRKGEKATQVEYWQWRDRQKVMDDAGNPVIGEDGKQQYKEVRLQRPKTFRANVFNAEQIDGMEPYVAPEPYFDPIGRAEETARSVGASILHDQGDKCFYTPAKDEVHMVPATFESQYKYYAILMHEVGHATGHGSRLDRKGGPFGSELYAKEELRAEMASFMITTEMGLGHYPERHAGYVEHWMSVIKDDKNALFQAARDADRIVTYIMEPEKRLELERSSQNRERGQQEAPKTWLNVPYDDKEEAKAQGAKWDRTAKSWYVQGDIPEGLEKWRPAQKPEAQTEQKQERTMTTEPQKSATQSQETAPEQSQKTEKAPKTWLNVPYEEKDEAKAEGAKWDRRAKSWYVRGDIPEGLEKWRPSADAKPEIDPSKEFGEAIRAQGLLVEGNPIMDGTWRRVQVEGDTKKERNGSYKGFMDDGVPAGLIMNYKTGEKAVKWVSTGNELTEEQRIELKREAGIRADEQFKAMVERHRTAGKRAYGMWANGVEADQNHPYLQKKQIEAAGMKMVPDSKTLMVPMQDAKGKIWSVQFIDEKGEKRFIKEGRKEGLFHQFGDLNKDTAKQLYIAEGVATAATIHHATGKPTLAAFDCGNLKPVAEAIKKQYPEAAIVIAADNDHNHKFGKNIGMIKAEEAAKAVEGAMVAPKFTDAEKAKGLTDFNDMAVERGLQSLTGDLKPPAPAKTAEQSQTFEPAF